MEHTYYRRTGREKRAKGIILVLSLVIAALVTGMVSQKTSTMAQEKTQEHLAQEVLRFHVLANSDSKADQALKMQVKEAVIEYLETGLPEDLDVDGTKDWVRRHTDELEQVSKDVIRTNGYTYPVSAAVTTCYFPQKSYGDITFPKGNYTALRVEIGEAKGRNWWCVLYPKLCFLDAVNAVVPEEGKEELKNVLTEDEYAQVTAETRYEIKWYLPELYSKMKSGKYR